MNGAAGDVAQLAISTPAPGTPASATSTATGVPGSEIDTVDQATTTVFSGQTVDLGEVLDAVNTGSYTAQIACDQPGLSPDADGQGGTYQVPAAPLAATCTITNTRTTATLILQKPWVNGAAGDQAGLLVSGSNPATAGSSTSTATGAAGSQTDTANRVTVTIFSGDTVTLAETLPPDGHLNVGTYASETVCDQPGLTADEDGQGGSYQVPGTPTAVTCTITNTRASATLVLQKQWVTAAAGDTATLTVSGSDPGTSGSATSTATGAAGSETDTVNQAIATIFSGETVDLVESLGAANTGSYDAQIACTPADGFTPGQGGQGGTYQVPAAPIAVTCTITNTRSTTPLILRKKWVNGAIGDTAALTIDDATSAPGFATAGVPANGNGLSTDVATTVVLSGAAVNLAETLGSANTGILHLAARL